MTPVGELLVGLALAIGLVGVVVQVLPGALLVLGAVLVWAALEGTVVAWSVGAIAVLATAAAAVVKYALAGRHLRTAGVPNRTLLWGGLAGVAGFFLVPVVGLPLGFVGAVYAAERVRLRDHARARRATVAALQATGITILVELAGALVSAGAWLGAVLLT